MKKVLIIAYYFPPLGWSGVQRTLKFVKYLRNFGWEPVVITVGKTKFSILDKSLMEEVPKDIRVIRIDDIVLKNITDRMKNALKKYIESSINLISSNSLQQAFEEEIEKKLQELREVLLIPDGNAIWANNVIKELENTIDLLNINMVYTTSAPYSSHLIGKHIKERYNIPWVADFRDEWVNNADCLMQEESLGFKIQEELEKTIVMECNKIITTTPYASKNFIDRYKLDINKVFTITNGYDEEDFQTIEQNVINTKFTIIHNGSCYLNRSPYTFFKAIKNLIEKGFIEKEKIQIVFVGKNDVDVMKKATSEITKYNIVKEVGYCSHNQSLKLLSSAHLLLLVLGGLEKQKSVYPGKIFEYLRISKPILAISPHGSLVEKLLYETQCGINIEYSEVEEMEKAILDYYNKWENGEGMTRVNKNIDQYERKNLTKALVQIFDELHLINS